MKGIFHPDRGYDWEYPSLSLQEIKELDPVEDRCYLEYAILHQRGHRRERLMRKLGISELPEKRENVEDLSDEEYELYFVLREQVAREPDAEVLKEAAYEAPEPMARFAFCYLTKYCFPASECDAYSYRTYECGWKEGMTTEDVVEFCREMIAVQGPFAEEARACLADPPKDRNDCFGERMVSHERAMSEAPYVRKERLAPFRESEEYEQGRAEVLRLEALGYEALAAGDKEEAVMLFCEMRYKSERLGKYTQRWEAIDDYARCCIAMAEAAGSASEAEEAALILRRLMKECPEEEEYRSQLEKAKAVYREAVKETAVRTGFLDEESAIVFYHSFEPKDAEVICHLIEERFRAKGGKRKIEFRWQEAVPEEVLEERNKILFVLPDGAGSGWGESDTATQGAVAGERWGKSGVRLREVARSDEWPEIGNICCCDLPTMIKLYDTGNISAISPFIDTDNVFPALLEQGRIEGDVCGLPVLVFAASADGSAVIESTSVAGDGTAVEAAGVAGGGAVVESVSAAANRTTGYRAYFVIVNNYSYGLKRFECLDLQMLMTDSDFLYDVCMACNAGCEVPRVFPADKTVCARLAEKEAGYRSLLAWDW